MKAVVEALESSGNELMIMAELDPSQGMPLSPLEAARVNKACLQKLGYEFRESAMLSSYRAWRGDHATSLISDWVPSPRPSSSCSRR